jgi:DNA-binding NarL/FixJ family response regulator
MDATPLPPVIALVRDLMFSSKVAATARAVGREVVIVREPGKLGGQKGRILLVDLNLPGAIEAGASWRAENPTHRVVGFVSHVDTATIQRAREAGLEVMARSGFVEALPALIEAPN